MRIRRKKSHNIILYNFWVTILVALGILSEEKEEPVKTQANEEDKIPILLTNRVDAFPVDEKIAKVFVTEIELFLSNLDEPLANEKQKAESELEITQKQDNFFIPIAPFKPSDFTDDLIIPEPKSYEAFSSVSIFEPINFPVFPSYLRSPVRPEIIVNFDEEAPLVSSKPDENPKNPIFMTPDSTGDTVHAPQPDNSEDPTFMTPETSDEAKPVVAPTDPVNDEAKMDEPSASMMMPDNDMPDNDMPATADVVISYGETVDFSASNSMLVFNLEIDSILTVPKDDFDNFLKHEFLGEGKIHFIGDIDESEIDFSKISDKITLEERIAGENHPIEPPISQPSPAINDFGFASNNVILDFSLEI